MDNGEDAEDSTVPDAENGTASDETPTMMDNIFRPIKDEGEAVAAPVADSAVEEGSPEPAVVSPDDGAEVDVQVVDNPAPEPVWRRKWFIGVVAALIGSAVGAVVWGASLADTGEQEAPPLVATPQVNEPVYPEVTVTETVDTTATATEIVETTATATAKVRVTATATATATTRIRSTATETLKINSTATETVEISADPAPTVVVTVTKTVVRQNSQGLMRDAATIACADAVEVKLENDYPDAVVSVPRSGALVAALRNDLDSWFIKVGATVDDAEQIVDCYVSGNDSAPSVDSILVR